MVIGCESRVARVIVHARGALVTRRVAVPAALADGELVVAVAGVTALAEPTSVRAALPEGSGRAVLAVRSALVVPEEGRVTGPSVERLSARRAEVARLREELGALAELRGQLAHVTLDPRLSARRGAGDHRGVEARVADALAADAMITGLAAALDARAIEVEARAREAAEALAAEELRDAQARSGERAGAGQPTLTVSVHVTGTGALPWLEVTYAVGAARWWPVYALRIREQGRQATWIAEGLVAQRSGEDWSGVRLALSTADLLFDARLPELPSLRFGRAQPPARRGYRAAPPDLDRMFEGLDRSTATMPRRADGEGATGGAGRGGEDAEETVEGALEGVGLLPLAKMPAAPMPMRAASRGGGLSELAGGIVEGIAEGLGALGGGGQGAGPEESGEEAVPLEPEGAWLDFDSLRLMPARDRAQRGRLVRAADARAAQERERASAAVGGLEAPAGAQDPMVTRGMFDHRYEVAGEAELPSDGLVHRVLIGEGEAATTLRWRTVPREAPEVFREAELRNPFDAPLLGGPVEVFVDGSLLAVASIDRVDRGGSLRVGMGVEQRLRVARNVRAREETAGILGGDTVVTHDVAIELTSALGASALVEVLDRRPVTDDKDIAVTLVRSAPEAEAYTQAERGAAVRGGLVWRVIVPAGGRATVDFTYRVTLPSKSELWGGNRRE